MNISVKDKKYLSPTEVADLLMVTPMTVRRWANKGELRALTTPGGHRRFTQEDVDKFAQKNGISLAPNKSKELRVLIVDDDKDLALYLSDLLLDGTNQVVTKVAHNGFAAGIEVKIFEPDVIITDLMMPEMDGIEVCQLLKSHSQTSGIRIIGITGYYTEKNVLAFIEAGAEECLKKPIDPVELLEAIGLDSSEFKSHESIKQGSEKIIDYTS